MTGKRRRNVSVVSVSSCSNSEDENYEMDLDNTSNENDQSKVPGSGSSGGSNDAPRRRGRGPSKRPCTNRNAMMARVNRQRKKEYVEKLESKLSHYRTENKNLSNIIQQQGIDLKRLTAEVSYLRNVLNNNSSITALLKTMNAALGKGKKENQSSRNVKWDSESIEPAINKKLSPESKQFVADEGNKNMKTKIARKALQTFVESDHNYGYGFLSDNLFDFEGINCDSSENGVLSLESGSSPSQLDAGLDLDISSSVLDRLDPFEPEMFDLPSSNVGNEETNLFENLDSTGICLHVNSGKISLEFCSICHLNSINSDDP